MKFIIILVCSLCSICNATDKEKDAHFVLCKNNVVPSLNEPTKASFILNDTPYFLSIWNNGSDNLLQFADTTGLIVFSDISVLGNGLLWSGTYQENEEDDLTQGLFYRLNRKIQHVYKSSGGRIFIMDDSVIVLSYKGDMHSDTGEILFLELNEGKLRLTTVLPLPGKPASLKHLGNERYIISGYKDQNQTWAFVLSNKENVKNLQCVEAD